MTAGTEARGSKTSIQGVWITILVAIVSKRGMANLDIKPSDAIVLQNGSTFFNCSTFNFSSSSEDIAWYHSVGSFPRKDVYEDGEIRTNYEGRFRVEKDLPKGVVNLVVQAPTLEDAGRYECQDGNGIGETAHAQLIVIETEPVCRSNIQPDGVIGSNDCGINPDQVEMSCSIKYRGNIPVHLKWRNGLEDDNSSLAVECSNTTNRSTCNLTVIGDRARNNSAYICQVKDTGTNTYSCSSDVIKILYAKNENATISVNGNDEFRCSVNSNQQCSYTWYSGEKNVSTSENLKPTKSGQYLCKANCNIRGQVCIVTASSLNVSFETANEETSNARMTAVVIVSFFMVAAISTIGILVCRRAKKTKVPNATPETQPLEMSNESGSNHTNTVDSIASVDCDIKKACEGARFIDSGLGSHIFGPGQYVGKQCAFERIMCTPDQQTAADEGVMAAEGEICSRGRQWMEFNHENLIKFYDVVLKSPTVFIAMEYAAGGSARKALKKRTEDLPVTMVLDWARQMAEGMNYLHEKGIIHRSLKCAQVLIMEPFDSSTSKVVTIKVASFNLAFDINKSIAITFNGMFPWMAPEVMTDGQHSIYSDIWSFGVTVWEILTRRIPHEGNTPGQLMKDIPSGRLTLDIPKPCPQILRDIFEDCFNVKPKGRPEFSEILNRLCNN